MSENSEKSVADSAVSGVTAVAVAWLDLANLLIETNVIKKDHIARMLAENAKSAEADGRQVEKKMFLALKGGLDRE